MNGHFKQFSVPSFATASGFLLAVVVTIEHTAIGAGAGALLGGIFCGGKGAGIGSIIGGVGGLGTTAFHGHQKITAQQWPGNDDSHYEQIAKSWEKARLACRIQQM